MTEEIKQDNNCIIKAFENNPISIIKEEENNKKIYYFKASDIGKALNLSNIAVSIQSYDEDEKVLRKAYDVRGCEQETSFLSSQGVYRLLFNSKKPIAKKFRKWASSILDDIIFNESIELKKQLENKEKQLQEQERKIQLLENKPETEGFNIKPGYIYILKDTLSLGCYKIGFGENPNTRITTLNISSSQKSLKMMHTFKCINMKSSEKIIHLLLDSFKIKKRNEWFYFYDEIELNYAIHIIKRSIIFSDTYNFIDYNSLREYAEKLEEELVEKEKKSMKITNTRVINKNNKLSNYHGVFWCIKSNNWATRIGKDNKYIFLGNYETEKEAAIVYNDYACYLNKNENKNYILNEIEEYIENPRNVVEENIKKKFENKSSNFNGVYFIKSKQIFEASIQYKKKSYKLCKNEKDIECAKIYNEQALYFNNHFETNYKLNDIPNFTTIEKNHVHELEKSKNKRYSRFVGVTIRNDSGKFRAYIKYNRKVINCGTFKEEVDAARAYNKKAEELNALPETKRKYELNNLEN
jgi:prophage antirepressor-like protein